jgi:hypothetical protein
MSLTVKKDEIFTPIMLSIVEQKVDNIHFFCELLPTLPQSHHPNILDFAAFYGRCKSFQALERYFPRVVFS